MHLHILTALSWTKQPREALLVVLFLLLCNVLLLLKFQQFLLFYLGIYEKNRRFVLVVNWRVVIVLVKTGHLTHESMHDFKGIQTHIVLKLVHIVLVTLGFLRVFVFDPLFRVHILVWSDICVDGWGVKLGVDLEGLSVIPLPPVLGLLNQVSEPHTVFHTFTADHGLPYFMLRQNLLLI